MIACDVLSRRRKTGIVELTDQLLEACVGSRGGIQAGREPLRLRLDRQRRYKEGPLVPLPPAAFRTILARIAALCNQFSPNAVTPYGGEGLLTVKGPPATVVRVAFVNTPDEQLLKILGAPQEILEALQQA